MGEPKSASTSPKQGSGILEDGAALAKQVQRKASQVDKQLGISQGIKRAWSASTTKAKDLDEQYGISTKASEAASSVKATAVKVDEQIGFTETVSGLSRRVSKFLGFGSPSSSPKLSE